MTNPSLNRANQKPARPAPWGRPVSLTRLNLFYRLPVAALCLAIFWQSSYAIDLGPQLFTSQDKVLHLGGYGLLAFLSARWLSREKPLFSRGRIRLLAIVFATAFGLSDEIHQSFVMGRYASILDFAADGMGALIGAWFFTNVVAPRCRTRSYTPKVQRP